MKVYKRASNYCRYVVKPRLTRLEESYVPGCYVEGWGLLDRLVRASKWPYHSKYRIDDGILDWKAW
jgi:hypothetical protein